MLNYYKYYIVVDEIEREVFPYGSFNPVMERINGFMVLKLSGKLQFSDSDIRTTNDYTYLLDLKATNQYLDFRVKRYNSGSYETYLDCILSLYGEWNASNTTCILTQKNDDNLSAIIENFDVEMNLLSFSNGYEVTDDQRPQRYSPCIPVITGLQYLLTFFLEKNITVTSQLFRSNTNPVTNATNLINRLYLSHKQTAVRPNDSGTASNGNSTKLFDDSKDWEVNIFIDKYLSITNGQCDGTISKIISNDETSLTVATFGGIIDNTSEYQIVETAEALQINTSIEQILKTLGAYNIGYYFSGDVFYIEHISYFEKNLSYSSARTVGIDLTDYTLNSVSYEDKFIKNLNSYKDDIAKIVQKELFAWAEYENFIFKDLDIKYDLDNTKKREIKLSNIGVDVENAYKNDEVSTDGLFLFAVDSGRVIIDNILELEIDMFESFTNSSYSTFLHSDRNITSAIATGSSFAKTNKIKMNTGDVIKVTFDFILLNGVVCWLFVGNCYPAAHYYNRTYKIIEGYNEWYIPAISFDVDTNLTFWNKASGFWRLDNFRIEKTSSEEINNSPLSWIYIIKNFWYNSRILLEGYVNGKLTTFLTKERLKLGAKISNVPVDISTFDAEKLVKTDIGNGLKEKIEINNGLMNFELSYE